VKPVLYNCTVTCGDEIARTVKSGLEFLKMNVNVWNSYNTMADSRDCFDFGTGFAGEVGRIAACNR
jgi:hypothetical protein